MDEAQKVYVYALKALTRRDHGETELRRKLTDRGFSPGTVAETIDRLKQSGYRDDRRFARCWAESAVRNGRRYGFRLRLELARRGVADDIVTDVVNQVTAEYDEAETIKELVARKFSGFDPLCADERQKRRVVGYLQRRGFSLSAILQVLRDAEI